MSKRLQILVPHYKSPQEELTNLLDMIYVQRGIDFNDIGVIIANDGDLSVIDEEFLNHYRQKFDIEYHILPHAGVSATRNRLLDLATADFIMFCDDDDTFLSNRSLRAYLDCINSYSTVNIVRGKFQCEFKTDNSYSFADASDTEMYSNIHGIVIRRSFLLENNIRFFENISMHEDSIFNLMISAYLNYDNEEELIINSPTYIYCHNANSICKINTDDDLDFVGRSTDILFNSRYYLFKELIRRRNFNDIHNSIVSQSIVMTKYLQQLENLVSSDADFVGPIFIHALLCYKRLMNLIGPTIISTSPSKFTPFVERIYRQDEENKIENGNYKDVMLHYITMANQLSFENDPLVVWYVCDDGDIDYNQADVVYYVKYKKSSKGVNKSVSELFYTNVNETGTDEEERTERNDNDNTQVLSGNPNLDRMLYKHINKEEYKEVIL
jgi:glycosyltransferase involved in cell wall biosynthesis